MSRFQATGFRKASGLSFRMILETGYGFDTYLIQGARQKASRPLHARPCLYLTAET